MVTDRVVVLAPGGGYTVQGPLLAYAGLAAERRGAEVRSIAWERPAFKDITRLVGWVRDQVAEVLGDDHALIVGKSLGTLAAGLVADLGLPAVWLTPLLSRPEAVELIAAARVPPLLVGGTADDFWDGRVARSLSPHVLEIPDADHGLYVPGPASATVRAAGLVVDAVEAYLEHEVWPR